MLSGFSKFFKRYFKLPHWDDEEVKTNSYDLNLIKRWEGLELDSSLDTGGVWTIGWGHTSTARPNQRITLAEAEILLARDVKTAVDDVRRLVDVPLNHNQRSALISFVFNIGGTQFSTSTLRRKLNRQDYEGASKEFLRWVYDNGKFIQGLKNRRKEEVRKFLS